MFFFQRCDNAENIYLPPVNGLLGVKKTHCKKPPAQGAIGSRALAKWAAAVHHYERGRFRKGSVAKRVALSVVALYALLLQAFVVAAAPVPFTPAGAIPCVQDDLASPRGGETHHNHHGLCCVVACAAGGSAMCRPQRPPRLLPRGKVRLRVGRLPTGAAPVARRK